MLERLRSRWTKVIRPFSRWLLRRGLTPDAVTWVGAIASIVVAAVFFPLGWLWQGVCVLLVFIFSDSLDGTMARESGQCSRWGAFLDSTLDRLVDGAIFGGLALYFAGPAESVLWSAVTIGALVFGQVTPYSKARGESLGVRVEGGLAGRADRLFLALVGALVTGLGVVWALPAAMAIACVAGAITVGQRMAIVRRGIQEQASTTPSEIA